MAKPEVARSVSLRPGPVNGRPDPLHGVTKRHESLRGDEFTTSSPEVHPRCMASLQPVRVRSARASINGRSSEESGGGHDEELSRAGVRRGSDRSRRGRLVRAGERRRPSPGERHHLGRQPRQSYHPGLRRRHRGGDAHRRDGARLPARRPRLRQRQALRHGRVRHATGDRDRRSRGRNRHRPDLLPGKLTPASRARERVGEPHRGGALRDGHGCRRRHP